MSAPHPIIQTAVSIGHVLLVEDDTDLRDALQQGLELAGCAVTCHVTADEALSHIDQSLNAVVVTDIRMPGMNGLDFMAKCLDIDPALPVVVMTGHGDVPLAVEAMKAGAWDFLEKPFTQDRLVQIVIRGLEKRRLVLENRGLRAELSHSDSLSDKLIGNSPAMTALRQQILALAPTDADVLITGETGAGKEVVARALHDNGARKDGPFVAINCGALPADMIESELFGHEAGAFTSAQRRRIGKLEHANTGTVFLDEIESMPLDLQVKLLRVIEGRTLERLGSNAVQALDIRFVAATKVDLLTLSNSGEFRSDLVYRLNVASLHIPPLRDRTEDIPDLVRHLAVSARARYRKDIPAMDAEILDQFMGHTWPGNVRELRNEVDRWVLGLPITMAVHAPPKSESRMLSDRVASYERSLIMAEIEKAGGRLKDVYASLGLSRKGLYDKMRKYDLSVQDVCDADTLNEHSVSNV